MGARIEGWDRAGPPVEPEPFRRTEPDVPLGAGPGGDGVELRTLLSRLGRDATQLAHDEMELAKIEIRDVAQAFSSDIREAGQTLAKDLAKIGVALSLAFLAGLALTAGAVLAVGQLLGDAFWAGGLIVGAVLLLGAGLAAASAARDMRESEALRMEHGKRTLQRDRDVLRDEAKDTQAFAKREAREFKQNVKPGGGGQGPRARA